MDINERLVNLINGAEGAPTLHTLITSEEGYTKLKSCDGFTDIQADASNSDSCYIVGSFMGVAVIVHKDAPKEEILGLYKGRPPVEGAPKVTSINYEDYHKKLRDKIVEKLEAIEKLELPDTERPYVKSTLEIINKINEIIAFINMRENNR